METGIPSRHIIRQAPQLEAAAPYGAPPCEEEWSVPAPEAEDLQELLLELGFRVRTISSTKCYGILLRSV